VRTYRLRLPHIDNPKTPVFVTWRLWGSLPAERTFKREHLTTGQAFVTWDWLLDTARHGPRYLEKPEIAGLVRQQLLKADADGLCSLHGFVVMPNHVHLLCTPVVSIAELVQRLKGATAHLANGILGRRGEKFWQEEYFDRIVRNDGEFHRIQRYIDWNPVKACLAARPEEFPWSSAWRG
jgi:REP element-mobilizing transposase RayT